MLLRNNLVWTIEFKKRDWRRAIAQARDHLLGADYAYVCLAECEPSSACLEAARGAGVGVLRLRKQKGWPFQTIVKAPRSPDTWEVARSRIVQQLKSA